MTPAEYGEDVAHVGCIVLEEQDDFEDVQNSEEGEGETVLNVA